MPVNPAEKRCWKLCPSCFKCSEKGKLDACGSCSGRFDPGVALKWDPYDRDQYCDCKNGILRHKLQDGRMMVRKFLTNPFAGKVVTDAVTEDERDWNQYITEKREQLGDEHFDPLRFDDGQSTWDWMNRWRQGEIER